MAMDALLASHRVPIAELRGDDFAGFYEARKRLLLKLIESVMDKTALRGLETEDAAD